MTFVTKS